MFTRVSLALLLAMCTLLLLKPAQGHEVPADVAVQAWLKPEGRKLKLLLRAPLAAMRDLEFPQHGPGYLDIEEADRALRHAAEMWMANGIELYEGDERLTDKRIAAVRVSLPSDQSFREYETALANVTGKSLPGDTELVWTQGLLDVLIEVPTSSAHSQFSVQPGFARLGMRTVTALRFLPPDGSVRAFEFAGDPGLVTLDPRWHQAFSRFVSLGVTHILTGYDHLLFVMCLIIPFRRLRPLVMLVTAFTVAHSITLLSAAFGFAPKALWFPSFIETMIAASIVYMALENILGTRWRRRSQVAFAFGLVHGFGFSFALSESLQFAGNHLLTSLLAFNLGVELGQILAILLVLPLLNLALNSPRRERIGTVLLSALLAHSGWHWMSDRAAVLTEYSPGWPSLAPAALSGTKWFVVGTLMVLAGWFTYRVRYNRGRP